jgi:hypothetical protein
VFEVCCDPSHRQDTRKDTSADHTLCCRAALTLGRAISEDRKPAPRGGLNLNRGFVELGSYALNRLRRKPPIEFYAWNAPPTSNTERNDPGKPDRDPLRLARYYQSLLDTGNFESRAALARFLGVSRARVTQVMKQLCTSATAPRITHQSPQTEGSSTSAAG